MRTDASRLLRALLNLLVNALKFTDQGRVSLSATAVKISGDKCTVRFDVSDTGRGMTPEQLSKATVAYVGSPTDQDGGMGLGLTIATKAVASLGGELRLTSGGVGFGTSCSFHLQLKACLLAHGDVAAGEAAVAEVPLRVMLVDDVDILLAGAREIVESLGHEVVHTAVDGEECLTKLKQHAGEIDVAFVDIRLPKLFGDAAVAQYRAWEREHRHDRLPLRIYSASGDATSDTTRQHVACGFDGTLAKPIYPHVYSQLLTPSSSLHSGSEWTPSSSSAASSPEGSFSLKASWPAAPAAPLPAGSSVSASQAMLLELPAEVIVASEMLTQMGLNVKIAVSLVGMIEKHLGASIVRMEQALADEQKPWDERRESMASIAHAIKGAALQCSARRLVVASGRLEKEACSKAAKGGADRTATEAALQVWYAPYASTRCASTTHAATTHASSPSRCGMWSSRSCVTSWPRASMRSSLKRPCSPKWSPRRVDWNESQPSLV